MSEMKWNDERSTFDAPVWLNADEAVAWANGWNAAVAAAAKELASDDGEWSGSPP